MIEGYTKEDRIKELKEEIQKLRFDNPRKQLEKCNHMIQYSNEIGDDYGEAYAQYYLAEAYFRLGQLDEMIQHAVRGITIQKEQSLYELEARSYNLLGVYFTTQGDLQTGLNYYLSGLEIAKRYNLRNQKKTIYNNFGDLYMIMEDYKTAIYYFNKAKVYMKDQDEKEMNESERFFACIWYANLVEAYINISNYELAKEYMHHLLHFINDEFLKQHTSIFYSLLTRLDYYTGKTMQAQSSGDLFIRSVKERQDKSIICDIYIPGCKFFVEHDMLNYAKELLDEIKRMSIEIKNPYHWVQVIDLCIVFYKKSGDQTNLLQSYEDYYYYIKLKENQELKGREQNIKNQLELHKALKRHKTMLQKNEELTKMSEHDALTGLPNRYSINKYCEKLFAEARKNQQNFGLIIVDIDYFKQYNDTYGHVEGDKCIVAVTKQMSRLAKNEVYTARYGGDEFLVMALDKEDEYLQSFAQTLRQRVEQQQIEHKASKISRYVTVTQGVVNAVPNMGDTMVDFIHMADLALYKVKEKVRNAIGYYEGIEE